MKYLKRLLTVSLFAVGLLLSSCTDLSETPYSEVTAENYSPTAEDIVSLVAPVYTPLRFGVMGFHTWLSAQHESADVIVTPVRPNGWFDGGRFNRMHRHTWTATDGTPNSVYNMCFDGINAANRVLLQIDTGEIPIEDGREELIAELKVARAFYYAILLDSHGNVPIVTDFSITEPPQQSSRSEVYDFVVSELNANIPQLSETADQSTYGRFNKWAGKMVLAEVYLNAEVYKGTPAYQEAIQETQDIIDSGAYQLEDNYRDNFVRENQNSSEIILSVPYDEVNGQGNMFHQSTIRPTQQAVLGLETQPWGGASSQPQFVDSYNEEDTRLEDTWFTGPHYIDVGSNEPENFVKDVPRIEPPGTEFYHGYPIWKYEVYDGIPVHSDVDFPFYRYAETLMIQAEALLRTGSADEAADLVTQVRMRAFEDPADAQVTGSELQQGSSIVFGWWEEDGTITNPDPGNDIEFGRMLDELGWEFAAEGHRRTDLIRFGVFTTKTWLNHQPNGDGKILFPIPDGALNTNPNLTQNPGY
ncbi:RagB/SusD family nutrient uptake outer membrane protein [Aliifodinibius sp. S!AR15-10]|uniref:RagB/SusD family nutrient uptake outer membrane protein n=1 Tax=Aliifodinibius sp. S!AR15-10 TaxID=2950437 RepID=UPI0028657493|nr:RagB/SusD family nutrient uptake outer membrane protein [Aliifodinibius sp. S!AR15-10]MDR8393985.1 RagB/SusD family nutrient uptake outer membrane protein [Aliifodinibius sp. S!AR15-10]